MMTRQEMHSTSVLFLQILLVAFSISAYNVFCITPSLNDVERSVDRDSLIEGYFRLGIGYLAFLIMCHGIRLRHLKRILHERGLTRRKQQNPVNEIVDAIENELQGSGRLIGYRLMHQKLGLSYGLVVDRETVRVVMKALDPEGMERRSQHCLVQRKYHASGPTYLSGILMDTINLSPLAFAFMAPLMAIVDVSCGLKWITPIITLIP